jgi:hypothetical protein
LDLLKFPVESSKTRRLAVNSACEARQTSVDSYIKDSNSPSAGQSRQDRLHPLYLTHRESGPISIRNQCRNSKACYASSAEMNTITLESTLTCPECGFVKTETMPTDACQWFYECTQCHTLLKPKAGDCCVYCSYGTQPCPPIQQSGAPGAVGGSCCC